MSIRINDKMTFTVVQEGGKESPIVIDDTDNFFIHLKVGESDIRMNPQQAYELGGLLMCVSASYIRPDADSVCELISGFADEETSEEILAQFDDRLKDLRKELKSYI